MPRILILAGPNGAGKSTFAKSRFDELVTGDRFLNIDDIAAGRSGVTAARAAFTAARIGIKRRKTLIRDGQSFGVETTLAGRTVLRLMDDVRIRGYTVDLVFLYLADPTLCRRRVEQRVALGGHGIPTSTIERRYEGGLANLPRAWTNAHGAQLYDANADPRLIAEKSDDAQTIYDEDVWRAVMMQA